ncbi:MAG: nicotinamide mononucleotide transporter [Ruminococcaceae bacterium]|nr:nicotinamide mononucleotide transporter [Oscillospiraceae bacterium]
MKFLKSTFGLLNKFELILWAVSLVVVILSYVLSGTNDLLTLMASAIGVTSLIFLAKGFCIGQVLIIIFSVFYGIISFRNQYYGEMITYLCITTPIAVVALIQWIKHPFKSTKEVEVSRISKGHVLSMCLSGLLITILFYFILHTFGNATLMVSTISITTSYIAAYLTAVRSPYYALGYAANDIVLIILWIVASTKDISNIPMISCFTMFLINDLYGFYSWKEMEKRQLK